MSLSNQHLGLIAVCLFWAVGAVLSDESSDKNVHHHTIQVTVNTTHFNGPAPQRYSSPTEPASQDKNNIIPVAKYNMCGPNNSAPMNLTVAVNSPASAGTYLISLHADSLETVLL